MKSMSSLIWVLAGLSLLIALLISFLFIARKGRELRKSQPLPPEATRAFLQWTQDGNQRKTEVETPFYFGRHPECNVVLTQAKASYEVCIFYHKNRFAIQGLSEAAEFTVNGDEMTAGYLRDGDQLVIANQAFTLHCY
jgi:FHA domain